MTEKAKKAKLLATFSVLQAKDKNLVLQLAESMQKTEPIALEQKPEPVDSGFKVDRYPIQEN